MYVAAAGCFRQGHTRRAASETCHLGSIWIGAIGCTKQHGAPGSAHRCIGSGSGLELSPAGEQRPEPRLRAVRACSLRCWAKVRLRWLNCAAWSRRANLIRRCDTVVLSQPLCCDAQAVHPLQDNFTANRRRGSPDALILLFYLQAI